MLLIFSSCFYESDPQTDLLIKCIENESIPYILINPFSRDSLSKLSFGVVDGDSVFYYDNKQIHVSTVYISRQIRSDCIPVIPGDCDCTSLYRYKVNDFLSELFSLLADVSWFPGKIENISLGDSKSHLFKKALGAGLTVPVSTMTSFNCLDTVNYRKVLGYPFSISYSKEDESEIAVTLFNEPNTSETYGLPWQWQTKIDPKRHLRCVFINGKVWCFEVLEDEFQGKSLREVQEEKDVIWKEISLPNHQILQLTQLMKSMNLKFASPEFIINQAGEYIFIDLNPCGDWYGFGSEETSSLIASEIAKNLCV